MRARDVAKILVSISAHRCTRLTRELSLQITAAAPSTHPTRGTGCVLIILFIAFSLTVERGHCTRPRTFRNCGAYPVFAAASHKSRVGHTVRGTGDSLALRLHRQKHTENHAYYKCLRKRRQWRGHRKHRPRGGQTAPKFSCPHPAASCFTVEPPEPLTTQHAGFSKANRAALSDPCQGRHD